MKTSTRQKAVQIIEKIQDTIKGGPGSGPRPGGGRTPQPHNADAESRARESRAGTVGGRETVVNIRGEQKPSLSVFYQPTTSIGGYRSSESRLLGDWINHGGVSGNLRRIDPNGVDLTIQKRDGSFHDVPIKD